MKQVEGENVKIGIITWFAGTNYGTNLQAIALQRYLRNIGHDVNIVNFAVDTSAIVQLTFFQKLTDWSNLMFRIKSQPDKYAMKYAIVKYGDKIEKRNKQLLSDVEAKCCFTDQIHNESELIDCLNKFDLLICGSDQIWNPNWYHRFFYADYDEVKTKRISYGPSLGVNALLEEKIPEIKRSLSKFSAVSVREQKGADLIRPLMSSEPTVVLDPTFLLDAADWIKIFPPKVEEIRSEATKYVLSMFLTDNASHWKAARRFAKHKGLKHIVIPYCGFSYLQNADIRADAGLQDFLDLIRDAEYVLTDSFHVTAFSLIMHKQFYTFTRFKEDPHTSQNVRVRSILSIAGLEERLLPYGTASVLYSEEIDYRIVDEVLSIEISKSKEFLNKAI